MTNSYFSINSNGKIVKDIDRLIADTNRRFGANTIQRAANLPECNDTGYKQAA